MKNNIYFKTLYKIFFLFDKDLKVKSILVTILVLINVLIELIGLTLIFPEILFCQMISLLGGELPSLCFIIEYIIDI